MAFSSYKPQAFRLATFVIFTVITVGCDDSDSSSPDAAVTPDAAIVVGAGDAGADTSKDAVTTDGGSADAPPMAVVYPDVDMVFVRFDNLGTLDSQFGTGGVARVNLSARVGDSNVYDTPSSIARDADGRLVVFGSMKGKDRLDADRVVFRLTTEGVLDTTFASTSTPNVPANVYALNMGNVADNARKGIVQSDGKIVFAGYSPLPTSVGTQTANAIVLLRLNADGTADNTFGASGVSVVNPFRSSVPNTPWGYAEAYSVGLQDNNYVTAGYGRAAATGTVDVITARINGKGAWDETFGLAGSSVINVAGFDDRGRDVVVLQSGRIIVAGSTATAAMNAVDSMVAVLSKDGALDTTFNSTGYKSWDLGRSNDTFWGVDASADGKVAVVAGSSAGNELDDDAMVGVIPLDGTGVPVVKIDPLSETGHDRFSTVAMGADGKFYAAGFVEVSPKDTALVVVRYKADGTRDATFGTAGVATKNVAVAKGSLEAVTALVVLPDGKIVLAGRAEGN